MRAKWSAPIRKYWKISEQMMVKYPNDEIGIPWNDPELKINWPIKENEMPIIADKDLHYDSFSLLKEKLVQREE